jgi:hypothetical protein
MTLDIITYRHDLALAGSLAHMRRPETQSPWDAGLKVIYGLPLSDAELALFRHHTGRTTPKPGGYSEAVIITGRQSGKTQTAADIAAFEAITAPRDGSADGLYALLVAQDQRAALRALFRYVSAPFERVPMMQKAKVSATADTITLDNGVTAAAYPCRPAALRGVRARVAIIDELAFFRSSDGNPVDTEMLRAVRPTLATTAGKLIILSSPYPQTGALWDLHRAHYGRDDSDTLVWVASAPEMNPTLRADYLRRMEESDPEAFRSEVLGEFRTGISSLFDVVMLDASVGNWREQPPRLGIHYRAHFDPSGGKNDAAALAIAHADKERVIVDLIRAWPSPHNVESVAGEAVALAKTYGINMLTVDRYAPGHVEQSLVRHRMGVRQIELDTSALFLELLPRVMSNTVFFPNDPALLRELRGLERRRGFAGRDRCGHHPGAHDDRAAAAAGAIYQITRVRRAGGPAVRVGGIVSGGAIGVRSNAPDRRLPLPLFTRQPWRHGSTTTPCPLPAHARRTR